MPEIRAVIFDMDGVLIEAKEWHYDALNQALSLFGLKISRYDHLVTFDGLPTRDKLQMLSKEYGLSKQLHTFINEMKQRYTMEIVHARCKPRFYHEYALSKLRRDGYRLAVASNSIRNSVRTMMDYAQLTDYLEFYLSNEDVKQGKPSPEIYIKAISKLGLQPDQCLIVEDNDKGIEAAKASGAWVMEVNEVEDVNYSSIKHRIDSIEGRTRA